MSAITRHRNALVLLWLAPALVSFNYIIARAASGEIAPHLLALVRWATALALMLGFSWRAFWQSREHWRKEGRQLLVLGGLGMWICGAFVYIGGNTTSATNIALIYAATPVAIAFVGARLLHERLAPRQQVGMALALLGVVFVILKGDLMHLSEVRLTPGDGWILAAAIAWVAYSVLMQRWPTAMVPAARLAAITACGLIVILPFTVLEIAITNPSLPSWRGIGLAVLAGVVPGFLAYHAYAFMIRELGAGRAGLVMFLSPIYAALIAWLALGELPQWFHLVGAALILPSIFVASRSVPRRNLSSSDQAAPENKVSAARLG